MKFELMGLLVVLAVVDGYPDGAPQKSCADMLPQHKNRAPQPSLSPFRTIASQVGTRFIQSIEFLVNSVAGMSERWPE